MASLPAPNSLPAGSARKPAPLTQRQKAAIVVQFILKQGEDVPLSSLPPDLQATLTQQMGEMRYVDRTTLDAVIVEFADTLESVGLTFADGIGGTLDQLDGKISPQTARRLRKEAGVRKSGDPWDRLRGLDADKLASMINRESIEVSAVILSKVEVSRAAEVMTLLPGDRARRIAYAVSMTTQITPEAVDRIGLSLAAQLDAEPDTAFDSPPVDRVGAILNVSKTATREDVLSGLDEQDAEFAKAVRRAIFTFANIAERIQPVDVPKILRGVDQQVLITALAAAATMGDEEKASAEFLLDNMSKRMSDMLRDEVENSAAISADEGEEAMTGIVQEIRELVELGEIKLVISSD